jgi:hypothetical protein
MNNCGTDTMESPVCPIDYLVIGHITQDLQPDGKCILGGTASFAGSMARGLGLRAGIVTSIGEEADLSILDGIDIACHSSLSSTMFENRSDHAGRVQFLYSRAEDLTIDTVPVSWRCSPIVHLGPLVQEVDPNLMAHFPDAFIGITAQGWLRRWDENGRVYRTDWPAALDVLPKAHATVLSVEDVDGDWECIESWSKYARVLVVTQGGEGATIIASGERRHYLAHEIEEVDSTGAGDILAASFFIRYHQTGDPWTACRDAIRLASASVSRSGLYGVPSQSEIKDALDV